MRHLIRNPLLFACLVGPLLAHTQGMPILEDILADEENDYSAKLENGTLSFCCYSLFDVVNDMTTDNFEIAFETYTVDDTEREVEVFVSGDSFFKRYFDDAAEDPQYTLLSGRIVDFSLILNSRISKGMANTDFLSTFFQSSTVAGQVETVRIYQDEEGASSTSYQFEESRLEAIEFDSDNDWVEKGLSQDEG